MNYSPKSPMNRPDPINEVFTGADVADVVQPGRADLADWVDLMEVVEALCPVWPSGAICEDGDYRL